MARSPRLPGVRDHGRHDMMGASHVLHGVTAASWAAVPLAAVGVPLSICLLSMPVGAYAALLPDLDSPHATATWSLPPVTNLISWLIRGGPYDFALPIVGWGGAGRLLPWEIRHRQETHSKTAAVIFGLVLGLPLWLLPDPIGPYFWVFALQVALGCLAHRWGDQRTSGGLPGPHGRVTRGRTFDTGSEYETRLRAVVYRPAAFVSVAVSTVAITYLSAT